MMRVDHIDSLKNCKNSRNFRKQYSSNKTRPYIHQPWMYINIKSDLNSYDEHSTLHNHNELLRFSEWASITNEERKMREDLVERLKDIILSIHPEAKVKVYGSFKSDLCITQSDIDLVVCNTNLKKEYRTAALTKLAYEIHRNKISSEFPSVISSTKVPIIKLMDAKTKCMVDINFEFVSGLKNTVIMKRYLSEYPFLRPLTIIVKYYLKFCLLNDPYTGGIGSYSLLVLILSFLQNHTKSKGKLKEATEKENLATILIDFFQYYGILFDYSKYVVSVLNNGAYLLKEDKNWKYENFPDSLAIEDPENPDNDLGKASFNIKQIKLAFQHAYYVLTNPNITAPNNSMISKLIFIPHQIVFYRDEIKRLYSSHSSNQQCEKENTYYFENDSFKGDTKEENSNKEIENIDNTSKSKNRKKRYYVQIQKQKNQKNQNYQKIDTSKVRGSSTKRQNKESSYFLNTQHFPPIDPLDKT